MPPPEIDTLHRDLQARFVYVEDQGAPGFHMAGKILGNCEVYTDEVRKDAAASGLETGAALTGDHVAAIVIDHRGRAWLLDTMNKIPRLAWAP